MKKKAWLWVAVAAVALNFGITAQAAGTADLTVAYTAGEKMEYTSGDLTGVFAGIAPGETKTATIEIQNNSNHAANISISQETVKALEDASTASGGAYSYDLTYVDAAGNTVSLLQTVAGGYSSGTASTAGLKDVTELEDYTMISRLDSGDKTYVYLTLGVDGEGVKNAYKSTTAQIDLNFMASYVDSSTGKIVYVNTPSVRKGNTRYVDRVVEQIVPVLTGDNNMIWVGLVVLLAGVGILLVGMKKRKAGDEA
ncbi:MAG: LPXTG cell wall anchor domain-containing protein [Lachnospiraceae bacterium]|nr:LPXTG cell wall anchor domain-containing protein [Lachnospiraceae bacterium]